MSTTLQTVPIFVRGIRVMGIIFAILGLGCWSLTAEVQGHWRYFSSADGLPPAPVQALSSAPDGSIWIKSSGDRVVRYDGYTFTRPPTPLRGVFRVMEARGGDLWAFSEAGLQSLQQGAWRDYPINRVAEAMQDLLFTRRWVLLPGENNSALVLLPAGLFRFSSISYTFTGILDAESTGLGNFIEMAEARDGGLLITAEHGFIRSRTRLRELNAQSDFQSTPLSYEEEYANLQKPYEDEQAGVSMVAERVGDRGRKVLLYFWNGQWQPVITSPRENIRFGWRDAQGNVTALSGRSTLFQGGGNSLVEAEMPGPGPYSDILVENGDRFWISAGEGLWRRTPSAWKKIRPPEAGAMSTLKVTTDPRGRLWVLEGSPRTIYPLATQLRKYENNRWETYSLPPRAELGELEAESDWRGFGVGLWHISDKVITLADGSRSLTFDISTGAFSSNFPPANRILGQLRSRPGFVVWVKPEDPLQSRCEVMTIPLTIPPLFQTNYIRNEYVKQIGPELTFFYQAENGEEWVGGSGGLLRKQGESIQVYPSEVVGLAGGALSAVEVNPGLWFGGREEIVQFRDGKWSLVRKGLNEVRTMRRAQDGTIWVGTSAGLLHRTQGAWLQIGVDEGLPDPRIHDIHETPVGQIWVGTGRGLANRQPQADRDVPRVYINPLRGNQFRVGEPVELLWTGRDKWDFCRPEQLLFAHRIDGGEWSEFVPERRLVLSALPPGDHRISLRAIDRQGNIGPNTEDTPILSVVAPWFRDPRVMSSTFAGVAVALFFAILAFNRHIQLARAYAEVEAKVAQRTRELEVAHQHLLQSQKMKALGTLAAGIAHDFNNILSIIKGSAQIIEDHLEDKNRITVRVSRIKTMVDQGASIVKAMLGYSREGDKELVWLDLHDIGKQTLKLLGDQFIKKVNIEYHPTSKLPKVRGLQDLIQQMILNLIFNSADAMDDRGAIVLTTGRLQKLPRKMALEPAQASAYLYMAVEDEGCGIPPENMDRLFEPFFTTKSFSTRHGTGLGLSMVYEFAKSLGYGLAVESQVGKGSKFTVIFPVVEEIASVP